MGAKGYALISEEAVRKALKRQESISDLVEKILAQPCPMCGRMSLTYDFEDYQRGGVIVFCERMFCTWKPSTALAHRKVEENRRKIEEMSAKNLAGGD